MTELRILLFIAALAAALQLAHLHGTGWEQEPGAGDVMAFISTDGGPPEYRTVPRGAGN